MRDVDIAATGLAGYLGAETVYRLVNEGLRVRLFTRDKQALYASLPFTQYSSKIDVFESKDPCDEQALKAFCSGAKAIIHAAAVADPAWVDERPEEARRINVDMTAMLLSARAQVNEKSAFVYVSSLSVFGGNRGLCDSTTQPIANTVYAEQKLIGEAMTLASAERAVIIRPGTCSGVPTVLAHRSMRDDLQINHLVQLSTAQRLGHGARIQISGAKQSRPYIHIADAGSVLANLTIKLSAGEKFNAKVFNVVSPQGNLTREQIVDLIQRTLGAPDIQYRSDIASKDMRDCAVAYELDTSCGYICQRPNPADWVKELSHYYEADFYNNYKETME